MTSEVTKIFILNTVFSQQSPSSYYTIPKNEYTLFLKHREEIINFTFLSLCEYLADSSPCRIFHVEVYHTLAQHIIAKKRLRRDCPWIRQSPLSLFLSILGNRFLSYILSFLRLPCWTIVIQNQPQEFFSQLTLCTTFFCRDVVIMER